MEQIKQQIMKLSPEDVWQLAAWFDEYKFDKWDRQIECDVAAGRFDKLVKEIDANVAQGLITPL